MSVQMQGFWRLDYKIPFHFLSKLLAWIKPRLMAD